VGRRLGSGQQGTAYRLKAPAEAEGLVLKVFDTPEGAAGEVQGLYQMHTVLEAQQPTGALGEVNVVRVTSIGRTASGRSFIVKDYAAGDLAEGTAWLYSEGAAALLEALQTAYPGAYAAGMSLYKNVVGQNGIITIFDPM